MAAATAVTAVAVTAEATDAGPFSFAVEFDGERCPER